MRKGELIERITDPAQSTSQVVKLVEEAFGRTSSRAGGTAWTSIALTFPSIRARAIVSRVGDISYLDKFAILEDAVARAWPGRCGHS